MTTNPQTVDRIPLAHSVRYVARGLPEVPNQYGPGVLAPSEITLTYRAAPDSGLGRVHAYVAGRIWVDGTELPLLPGGLYGQHYDEGLSNWPEWLAEEARLHDPGRVVSAAPDQADQPVCKFDEGCHRVVPCDPGCGATTPPADLRQRIAAAIYEHMHPGSYWSDTSMPADWRPSYLDEADAVLSVLPPPADRAAVLAEVLPDWEAVYEPGNVSDYLIGYANDQDAATGMAEAWMRSQAEVTGRLEWVSEERLATGRYDRWFELIERHTDGIDTGPGIIVRRRLAAEEQQQNSGHVCKPGASVYHCPTSGQTESDCHGGFTTCCERPDLHQPAAEVQQQPEVVPCMRSDAHPSRLHSGLRKGVAVHGRCPGAPAVVAEQQPDTETQPATTADAKPVCICGHPVILHHEDVCLRADCTCADVLEISALPEALEAVLTKRFTELGNQFAEMRVHEQGPDGWPASRLVSPHMVAEALRELLRQPTDEAAAGVGQDGAQTQEAEPEPSRVVRCSRAILSRPHDAHDWEPQPGMDPVHCPGYRFTEEPQS